MAKNPLFVCDVDDNYVSAFRKCPLGSCIVCYVLTRFLCAFWYDLPRKKSQPHEKSRTSSFPVYRLRH